MMWFPDGSSPKLAQAVYDRSHGSKYLWITLEQRWVIQKESLEGKLIRTWEVKRAAAFWQLRKQPTGACVKNHSSLLQECHEQERNCRVNSAELDTRSKPRSMDATVNKEVKYRKIQENHRNEKLDEYCRQGKHLLAKISRALKLSITVTVIQVLIKRNTTHDSMTPVTSCNPKSLQTDIPDPPVPQQDSRFTLNSNSSLGTTKSNSKHQRNDTQSTSLTYQSRKGTNIPIHDRSCSVPRLIDAWPMTLTLTGSIKSKNKFKN